MPEPFKLAIREETLRALALDLARAWPGFRVDPFLEVACAGLDALELKDRVASVADVLRAELPEDWDHAMGVLEAAVGCPLPDHRDVAGRLELWPVLSVVERHGLDHPERSLGALYHLTRCFSGEFAVRPFLQQHPELAWATLLRWADDPNLHVRRLASEGSRPRLPWASALPASVADPSRGIQVIERLRDDPSPYVRRSVANHLNDVSRDHPEIALEVAERWMFSASTDRGRLVRHGLRTLLKAGDPRALALFGLHPPEVVVERHRAEPDQARVGQVVQLRVELHSLSVRPQALRIDWIVLGPGARRQTRRVVRGPSSTLAPGGLWSVDHALSMASTTTRAVRPGPHQIQVQVNGVILAEIRLTMLSTEEA